jgi:hypothetical protein
MPTTEEEKEEEETYLFPYIHQLYQVELCEFFFSISGTTRYCNLLDVPCLHKYRGM